MDRRLSSLAIACTASAVALTAIALAPAPSSAATALPARGPAVPAAVPLRPAVRRAPTPAPPSVTTRIGCRVESGRDTSAPWIGLSDTLGVTLTLVGCLPRRLYTHVVFVVDTDLGDEGEARQATEGLVDLVQTFGLRSDPFLRMAVVRYGARAWTETALTDDPERVAGALRRTRDSEASDVARGLAAGLQELAKGRGRRPDQDAIREIMILATGGREADVRCPDLLNAAGRVMDQGVLRIVLLASERNGRSTATSCLRQVASSSVYFFAPRDISRFAQLFGPITVDPIRVTDTLSGFVLTDTIPTAFELDVASVSPPAHDISADGRTLRWQLPATITYPAAAIHVSYRLRPRAVGSWPVSLGATATFTADRSSSGIHVVERARIDFPAATVAVLDSAHHAGPVCPATVAAVPGDVLAAALAHPERVSGWDLRCSPNRPAGPTNPLRRSLRLARPGAAYHPIANGLVWGCGCM